jgi:hypothetical protein
MEISRDQILGYRFRSIDGERAIRRSGGCKNKKKWHKTGIKAGKANTKLIVEECILLRLYTIKHDNHVTLLATIYLRANTIHVFIFTTCFGCDAPSSGEAEYNTC